MKKLAVFLLAVWCLSWCNSAGAQTRNISQSQSREERNLEKKQMKAQKKDAKARRKAERRMEKYDRKHTHDPNLPSRR
jgi:hypothetical protein